MSRGPGRKPRVSDEEILQLFKDTNDPVLSTAEVADELPIGRRGTLKRLQSLTEDGTLESKPIGGRNTVWWLPEKSIAGSGLSAREPADCDQEERPREPALDEPVANDIEPYLQEVEFPTSKDREACIQAVRAAYRHLQQEGSATMRQFVTDVMPEYPLGYTVPELEPGERYRGSWWRHVIRPGLNALPDVEPPKGAERAYRYVGEY